MNVAMTKKKRILSLITAMFLLLTAICIADPVRTYADTTGTAYKDEGIIGGNIYYQMNSDGKTVTITDCDEEVTSAVIPEVITVGDNSYTVVSLGGYVFDTCGELTSVDIPDSVTSIGYMTFYWCGNLTSITIPSSVTSIGEMAFCGCSSLSEINVLEGNNVFSSDDGVLFDKEKTELIRYPEGKQKSEYIIPNGVTSLANYAFYGCTDLTSVDIPDSVTSIGFSAFETCFKLADITIPDSVARIDGSAFDACESLRSITIPDGITSIESHSFWGCSSLESIDIPDSVTSIGSGAFRSCSSLKDITFPNSMTSIGEEAFLACKSLTDITIPKNVRSIGKKAFSGCFELTIYGYIGSCAETYATGEKIPFKSIGTISIPICNASVSSIPEQTCTGKAITPQITVILGGKTLVKGTDYTVQYSNNINAGTASITISGIGNYTGTITKNFVIVKPLPAVGSVMADVNNMDKYKVTAVVGRNVEAAYLAPVNRKKSSVTIPATVKLTDGTTVKVVAIAGKAFKNNKYVKKVTVGKNVENIGKEAFSGCRKLMTVKVSAGVKTIGAKAFYGDKKLKNITIKSKKLKSSTVGKQAFKGVYSKAKVNVPNSKVKAYKKFFYKKGLSKRVRIS